MKYLPLLMPLAFLSSCCNGKPENLYCDVENPAIDLDWLCIVIKEHEMNTNTDSVKVHRMEMPSFGEYGFLFDFIVEGTPLSPQQYYYTCNGTLICTDLGGVAGTDCNGKIDDLILGEIVYQNY